MAQPKHGLEPWTYTKREGMSYLRGVPSFCVWAVIWSRKLVRARFMPLWDDYSLGRFRIFVWSISNIRFGAFEWRLWRLAIVWAAWLSEVLRVKNPCAKSFKKWKIHLLSYDLIKKQADYSNSSLSKHHFSSSDSTCLKSIAKIQKLWQLQNS